MRLFVGSAIKTFVLCEALRQADSPAVVETIASRQLALDTERLVTGRPLVQPALPDREASEADHAGSDDHAQRQHRHRHER